MRLMFIFIVIEYRRQKGIVCFEFMKEKDCQDQKFSWKSVEMCHMDNENFLQRYFCEIAAYNT